MTSLPGGPCLTLTGLVAAVGSGPGLCSAGWQFAAVVVVDRLKLRKWLSDPTLVDDPTSFLPCSQSCPFCLTFSD